MKNVLVKHRGITLIALVITIIVLLILAGVGIAMLTGENSILIKAEETKEIQESTEIKEKLDMGLMAAMMNDSDGKLTLDEYIQYLIQNGEIDSDDVQNGDTENQKVLTIDKYMYTVEQTQNGGLNITYEGKTDNLPPKIGIVTVTNTTNTITVTVQTKRNDGGKIEYYIKTEDEEEYQLKNTTTDLTYTYKGLEQNKKYNIKVVAVAENEQTAEVLVDRITSEIPALTEADVTFTYTVEGTEISKETWTNKDVTVAVNTTLSGYTLRTSTDGENWSDITSQTFSTNGTIYAILWDGTNYGGSAAANVTNIDKTKPIVTEATATTNSIKITATDEASGIIGYAVTTEDKEPTSFESCASTKSLSTTVTGKTQGTTYYVWVKDEAGNISSSKSTETGNVEGLTEANTTFTYTVEGTEISKETWTNKDVTVAVNTTLNGYTLRTSTDGENWSDTTSQTFSTNGTIYAILSDGTNYGGSAAANVTNIDKTKPIVTEATATTNSIKITATDDASGIIGYAVTTEDEEPTSFESCASTKSLSTTVTGRTQGTTYYIWVKDEAGNISSSKSTETGNVEGLTEANTTFTYTVEGTEISKETWTNKDVTVTVSATLNGYTLRTSTDGKNWSDTTSQTFSTNGTIYAILWDGTNYGGSASANVTNIDKTKPIVKEATATTNSIKITATDEASGIIGYAVTTEDKEPTSFEGCTSTKSLSTTVTGKTQGTTYYVWVKDAVGNISVSKSTETTNVTGLTEANTTFTYTVEGTEISKETWTNKDVTVTVSTTVNGYTLRTSTDGKNWSNTTSQAFSTNGTIYAILWDGTNYGDSASANVTNIDKTKPIVKEATATTNSIKITATDEASGIIGYAVTTEDKEPTSFESCTSTKSLSTTITGMERGTTYYVWVKDAAGNISSSKLIETEKVAGLTSTNTIFTYKVDGTIIDSGTWTNQDVTVDVSTTEIGYTMQTSIDGENWEDITSRTFSTNGTIYVRLRDDDNNFGDYTTANITNIDKIAPVVTFQVVSITSTSVTIDASSSSDNEGGSGISEYSFTLGTGENFYSTDPIFTFTGLTPDTYYMPNVNQIKDRAGNFAYNRWGTTIKTTAASY